MDSYGLKNLEIRKIDMKFKKAEIQLIENYKNSLLYYNS